MITITFFNISKALKVQRVEKIYNKFIKYNLMGYRGLHLDMNFEKNEHLPKN